MSFISVYNYIGIFFYVFIIFKLDTCTCTGNPFADKGIFLFMKPYQSNHSSQSQGIQTVQRTNQTLKYFIHVAEPKCRKTCASESQTFFLFTSEKNCCELF